MVMYARAESELSVSFALNVRFELRAVYTDASYVLLCSVEALLYGALISSKVMVSICPVDDTRVAVAVGLNSLACACSYSAGKIVTHNERRAIIRRCERHLVFMRISLRCGGLLHSHNYSNYRRKPI